MDDFQQAFGTIYDALIRFVHELGSGWVQVQFGLIFSAAAVGSISAAVLRRRFDVSAHTTSWPPLLQLWVRLLMENIGTVIFVLLMLIAHTWLLEITTPGRIYLLSVAGALGTAWVVISLFAGLIRNKFVNRLVAIFAWTITALDIVGLRDPIKAALDSYGVLVGDLRITPLLLLKTSVLLLLTLWIANGASDFIDKRLRSVSDLTPSVQVLVSKLMRLLLITFAILIVLSSVGIDFSALAFFSGAVGVGLGFGLQKIVSNLVSGIILLTDKSIKPGDVITVGDQVGWVTNMGARYTSVDTRDGREILIPNEDFITQRVVNWSYSDYKIMLIAKFGVSYDSDPHHVRRVATAAAASVPRVINDPEPICYFEEFGDSSLNFSLRYWISDPDKGIITVRAPVMLALYDAFKREGIEIPYPVRDVRLTQAPAASPAKRKRKPAKK